MNTAVYNEPYQLPAGILALAVHGAFFALLYFGFTWRALPPATMSVELWQSLPDMVTVPPVEPIIEKVEPPKVEEVIPPKVEEVVPPKVEEVVPPPQPEVKPDIVLPEKKKVEAKPVEKKPVEKKIVEKKPVEQEVVEKKPDTRIADQQAARERAEQAAAVNRVVGEYTDKIRTKIRRNIVMPPDVSNDARAEFSVRLGPGGTVLMVELKKPSGNEAYDNAVDRAIRKSEPLPLPPDAALLNRFRELNLVFKPAE
ncbi:MAG: cell envelope integrity protein TolA [Nitrosomonadales bacterium]|nr:cell envelope integrity protein TolA [Nitrosomonadales bacterium]